MMRSYSSSQHATKFNEIMKEVKSIEPIVLKYREYKKAQQTIKDSLEILETEKDKEIRELAQMEMDEAKDSLDGIEEELKILLLPKDPNDERNVIMEIRGGTGGEESSLFAGDLFRMYSMYADKHGFKIEVLSSNETGLGGYKEISFMVNGEGAYSKLKYESGTHRVQRVPETESSGRVHTSAVTVAVLPEAVYQYQKKTVRKMILKDHKRPDGRAIDQIRPLAAEIDLFARTHGSAMFTRGQTQICTITTLAPLSDAQKVDGLNEFVTSKRYMHHYNFPDRKSVV